MDSCDRIGRSKNCGVYYKRRLRMWLSVRIS